MSHFPATGPVIDPYSEVTSSSLVPAHIQRRTYYSIL